MEGGAGTGGGSRAQRRAGAGGARRAQVAGEYFVRPAAILTLARLERNLCHHTYLNLRYLGYLLNSRCQHVRRAFGR